MISQIKVAADYWQALSFDTRYTIWMVLGVVLLASGLYVAYRFFRAALGHRKFRGTWYSSADFQSLLNRLLTDQRESNRVLQYDELQLIRKALLPSRFKPIHKNRYGGYF